MTQVMNPHSMDFALIAGTSYLTAVAQGLTGSFSDTNCSIPIRTAGTFSDLWVLVTANGTSATSTLSFRKNNSNGSQLIAIGMGTTGEFNDSTNVDSVTAGDIVNLQLVIAAGASGLNPRSSNSLFEPASGCTAITSATEIGGVSTANGTFYFPLGGRANATGSTEASVQYKSYASATIKNLGIIVTTNGRGTNSTVGVRQNGASVSPAITVAAGTTGLMENTSDTLSVVSDDLLTFHVTLGTGGGTLANNFIKVEWETSGTLTQPVIVSHTGIAFSPAAGATNYIPLGGYIVGNTTESNVATDVLVASTLSHLQCYLASNGVTSASTLRTRVNAADGGQTVTITASTTGFFEDTTGSDSVVATDEVNYQLICGAGGTTLNVRIAGMLATLAAAAGATMDMWFRQASERVHGRHEVVAYG